MYKNRPKSQDDFKETITTGSPGGKLINFKVKTVVVKPKAPAKKKSK